MIHESLFYIAQELNQLIRREKGLNEEKVILAPIVNQDGGVPVETEDKILLTLVNVEQETSVPRSGSRGLIDSTAPMYFNLYVLFSTSFKAGNYDQGLKYLSIVIGFFQANRAYVRGSASGLPDGVNQLTMEIVNQGLQEMHNLWGAIGAKYMPSILYKMRVLTFDKGAIGRINVPVSGVDSEGVAR